LSIYQPRWEQQGANNAYVSQYIMGSASAYESIANGANALSSVVNMTRASKVQVEVEAKTSGAPAGDFTVDLLASIDGTNFSTIAEDTFTVTGSTTEQFRNVTYLHWKYFKLKVTNSTGQTGSVKIRIDRHVVTDAG
jgi:hypothetical protein